MGDVSRSALALDLSISSTSAFAELGKLGAAVDVLQTAMHSIGAIDDAVVRNIGSVEEHIANIAGMDTSKLRADNIGDSINDVAKQFKSFIRIVDDFNDSSDISIDKINRFTEISKNQETQLKMIIKKWNTYSSAQKEQIKSHMDLGNSMDILTKKVDDLATANVVNTNITRDANKAFDALSSSTDHAGIMFSRLAMRGGGLLAVTGILADAFSTFIKGQDTYAKAMFRSAGSISELTEKERDLAYVTSSNIGEIREITVALANHGILLGDVGGQYDELTTNIRKFTYASGANIDKTAAMTATLTAAGLTIDDTTSVLNQMIHAQRDAGLSAEDLNEILDNLSKTTLFLKYAYGATSQEIEDYASNLTALESLGKKANISVSDLVNTLTNKMQSPLNNVTALAFSSTNMADAFKNGADMQEAMLSSMLNIEKSAGGNIIVLEALSEAAGFSMQEISSAARLADEAMKDLDAKGINYTSRADALQKYLESHKEFAETVGGDEEIVDSFETAMSTLSGRFKQTFIPIINRVTSALEPLSVVIMYAFDALSTILNPVFEFIKYLSELGSVGQATAGVLSIFLIASLLKIGKILPMTIGLVGKLTFGLFGMLKNLVNVGKGLSSIPGPGSIGKGGGIFKAIADGIAKFANPKVIIGIGVITVSLGIIAGAVIGLFYVMDKLGISVVDLGAAGLSLVVIARSFAAAGKILSVASSMITVNLGNILMGLVAVAASSAAIVIAAQAISIAAESLSGLGLLDYGAIALAAGGIIAFAYGLDALAPILPAVAVGAVAFVVAAGAIAGGLALIGAAWDSVFGEEDQDVSILQFTESLQAITSDEIFNKLDGLSSSLKSLSNITYNFSLVSMIDSVGSAIAGMDPTHIDNVGGSLNRFDNNIKPLVVDTVQLSNALNMLAFSIDNIGSFTISGNLTDDIIDNAEKYNTASSIVTNYANSIAGAMDRLSDKANAKNVITTKFVETVTRAYEANDDRRKSAEALVKIASLLETIKDNVGGNQGSSEILNLLKQMLPEIVDAAESGGMTKPSSVWS